MENNTPSVDVKYHKLASEYSKIRGQATVLKRALLDEQSKSSTMRETLRIKETALRRAEQEVDSLGFRNKQLEHRVASLQDDFERESKLAATRSKSNKNRNHPDGDGTSANHRHIPADPIFTEEFQKKIMENAQLVSLIADKTADIELFSIRISELEQQLSKCVADHTDIERKLRKELEMVSARNAALETKLAESISIVGSEDALSVSESDHTPIHRNSTTIGANDERIAELEKDIFHWKTKYEICQMAAMNTGGDGEVQPTVTDVNGPNSDYMATDIDGESVVSKEHLIYDHLMAKMDGLFADKCLAESKVTSYVIECESLGNNLEIVSNNLSEMEQKYKETHQSWHMAEEDLATTRINYEEQISVLTEQVISLSDQLASLK